MRGGLFFMARLWASHAIRGLATAGADGLKRFADWVDPTAPKHEGPAPEWQPRLWARNEDPRSDTKERRP